MLYLLVRYPAMASRIVCIQFRDTYAEAINFFNEQKSIPELQDMEQKPTTQLMQLEDTERQAKLEHTERP